MKAKQIFFLTMIPVMACVLLSACAGEQAVTPTPSEVLSPAPEAPNGSEPPEDPTPASTQDVEGTVRLSAGDVPKLEPYGEPLSVLLEQGLLTEEDFYSFTSQARTWIWGAELFDPADLPTFRFESNMVFEGAEELAQRLLEEAKNPGLGVRALHEQGVTGEGVNVAIIDQNLLLDHPEYADRVAAYYDSGCAQPEDAGSMHAPAVLSLLAGETVGVAPGAKVWFAAAPSWELDAAYYADCLNWIVEQNRTLPEGEKIRVVSVSAAPWDWANADQWADAVAAAEADGILVLDCRSDSETGFVYQSYGDPGSPEEVTSYTPGFPNIEDDFSDPYWADKLFAPASFRTTAQEYVAGLYIYTYWGNGGRSWAVPYAAGVLALGWQINPGLDAQTMKDLLFQSAWVDENGCHMIDPTAFVEAVKAANG